MRRVSFVVAWHWLGCSGIGSGVGSGALSAFGSVLASASLKSGDPRSVEGDS